jgi:hypothetical protein
MSEAGTLSRLAAVRRAVEAVGISIPTQLMWAEEDEREPKPFATHRRSRSTTRRLPVPAGQAGDD